MIHSLTTHTYMKHKYKILMFRGNIQSPGAVSRLQFFKATCFFPNSIIINVVMFLRAEDKKNTI